MNILPYKLDITNDLLTSRAGLLAVAQLMESLQLSKRIDQYFPLPQSNRGLPPSTFIKTFLLMQHEGSVHLDDSRHLQDDEALRTLLNLTHIPKATTLGNRLRRMGNQPQIQAARSRVNQAVLQSALHRCKKVTLDIDATEIIAHKAEAQWTYNKNKGYMPMVGHIAETGQIVATDFRPGNASPARENLEFIKYCQQALPKDCVIHALRIDAAGYQTKIIEYCDEHGIEYAIRAKTSAAMRAQIHAAQEEDRQTYRTGHCIGDYQTPFTLIIQRTAIDGQADLDLEPQEEAEAVTVGGYTYRAIATNRHHSSDSRLIHGYNQRAEDSENRSKKLKLDLGGDTLPCSDFTANARYLLITALSYNVFALMRGLLPGAGQPSCDHRALAPVRHSRQSGQNRATTVGTIEGRTAGTPGASADRAEAIRPAACVRPLTIKSRLPRDSSV